jgi:hypothetical protein
MVTEISKFSRLIQVAITHNLDEVIRELYYCHSGGLINSNLELIYYDQPEEFERVVRILTIVDVLFNCIDKKFVVNNVPKERVEQVDWFVRLFAYLQSESSLWEISPDDKLYPPSEDCKKVFDNERMLVKVDLSKLLFFYDTIEVIIHSK